MDQYGYDDVKATVMKRLRKEETVTSEKILKEVNALLDAFEAAGMVEPATPVLPGMWFTRCQGGSGIR